MIYIGIDPGASGGIAFLNDVGSVVLALPMPLSEQDLYSGFIDGRVRGLTPVSSRAVIERVWSSPGWGHVGAFKFGLSVGALRMALTAAGIPFDEVLPRDWQRVLGIAYPKNATKTQKKNITKRRAQQLFPRENVRHAIADALLLAEYARRLNRGLNGKAESLTRTEGTDKGTGGGEGSETWRLPEGFYQAPNQDPGRARAAQRPDPSPQRPGAGRTAGDGKHGRRPQDG